MSERCPWAPRTAADVAEVDAWLSKPVSERLADFPPGSFGLQRIMPAPSKRNPRAVPAEIYTGGCCELELNTATMSFRLADGSRLVLLVDIDEVKRLCESLGESIQLAKARTEALFFGQMTAEESALIAGVDVQDGSVDVSVIVAGFDNEGMPELSPALHQAMLAERQRLGRILEREDVLRLIEAMGGRDGHD